jgi:hypothetical protein
MRRRKPQAFFGALVLALTVCLGAAPALADAVAPVVTTIPAFALEGGTTALVGGRVNPENSPATYLIEYGTDESYGQSAPASGQLEAGSGGEATVVTEEIGGLTPGTTYHFRIVAENPGGAAAGEDMSFRTAPAPAPPSQACSNEAIRQRQGSRYLRDCRAYELVSPADKSGGSVKFDPAAIFGKNGVSPDGSRVLYQSWYAFAGAKSSVTNSYRAERGTESWTSVQVNPEPSEGETALSGPSPAGGASEDLSKIIVRTNDNLHPLDQDGVPAFGNSDIYTRTLQGPVEWESRPNAELPDAAPFDAKYTGNSADASHVLFQTAEPLVEPETGPAQIAGENVYDRSGGETVLVGVAEDGSLVSQCGADVNRAAELGTRTISDDGTRIAFIAPDPAAGCFSEPTRLYLRVGGQETREVSHSQLSPEDPTAPVNLRYQGMTPDGGKLFFDSANRLSADAGSEGGLYEYDVASHSLHLLAAAEATVRAISDDGSRLYFTSGTQLTASGNLESGNTYLYKYENGTPSLVANVEFATTQATAFANPDGSTLAFVASGPVTAYSTHGFTEVYVYDSASDQTRCVSCMPNGAAPTANARLLTNEVINARPVSGAGRRVFFESPDRLAPGDSNSSVDVYEFDGEASHLISSGDASAPSYFAGASANGSDVMFSTPASLVAVDTDGESVDIYDARVDGGLQSQNPEPAPSPCQGESCRGDGVSSVAVPGVGSAAFNGPADKQPKRKRRHHKKHHHKSPRHRGTRGEGR